MRGENCDNNIFVLDGDVYREKEEQEKRLKAVLTGDDENAKSLRKSNLDKIKCLNLPPTTEPKKYLKPEKYIHTLITKLDENSDSERSEIIEVAKQIVAVNDDHEYVNDIIHRLDLQRDSGLSKIVDLVSTSSEWMSYIADIKSWLESKSSLVKEIELQET